MEPNALPDRSRWILAVLAAEGAPVWNLRRLRVAVFIVGKRLNPPDYFRFVAHAYGPFDPSVGRLAESLVDRGQAVREGEAGEEARYQLTGPGRECAGAEAWTEEERDVFSETSRWVREHPYTEVLTDVYRQWPEIRLQGLSGYVPGHSM